MLCAVLCNTTLCMPRNRFICAASAAFCRSCLSVIEAVLGMSAELPIQTNKSCQTPLKQHMLVKSQAVTVCAISLSYIGLHEGPTPNEVYIARWLLAFTSKSATQMQWPGMLSTHVPMLYAARKSRKGAAADDRHGKFDWRCA